MNAAGPMDPVQFKAATRKAWDRYAKGWNGYSEQITEWLHQPTKSMLAMAGIAPGARVLDVAAGAGDQTLDIAARVGPRGFVLATDLSSVILTYAMEKVLRSGYGNVETLVADGEDLRVPEGSFDAAVCRLGLMFLPDPGKGLKEMFRALKPGGRACSLVFATPEKNPCVSILVGTALKHAGLPPRDPYQPGGLLSLGKPGRVDELFRQAGFERVATTSIPAPFRLPSARVYLDFIRTSASPILQILEGLNDAAREAAWAEIEFRLTAYNSPHGWEGPNELLLTCGRRPSN